MAKHKAPTQVTIASTADESEFSQFVEKHWKTGVFLALLVAVAVLSRVYLRQKGAEKADQSWMELAAAVTYGDGIFQQMQVGDPDRLAGLAEALADDQAGPYAKGLEVSKRVENRDYAGARTALQGLESRWPEHPLVTTEVPVGEAGGTTRLADLVGQRIAATQNWEEAHPGALDNPPLPPDAPRVKLVTSVGDLVLGLYTDRAPRHGENFLKLCREGFYDNTKFHRVMRDFMVQGGDPNTREDEPETWGTGGPGYKLDPEISVLVHLPHVLAAAKQSGESQSSGSQFYITTGSPRHLDRQHTIFGRLVEGEDVLAKIEQAQVEGERPVDPVVLISTEVLE